MTKASNKIVKIIGSDHCKSCSILYDLIKNYIEQKKINIKIKKINSTSDEAIDLAMNFEINSIPFAIFKNKKIIFYKTINKDDLKNFLA